MRFKVIKRKFKIDNANELSEGCRIFRMISCSVENLDSGELLKIKSKTASGLGKIIIDRVEDFDLECGDIILVKE
jgi:hypothetical protein